MSFRTPDVLERRNNAAAVKKAMLEKFRAVALDPVLAEQQRAKRVAVNEAREARIAEREAARKVRDAGSGHPRPRVRPSSPRRRNARPRQPRRSPRLRRPNAHSRWRPSKKPSATPATRPAKPPKRSAGAAINGLSRRKMKSAPSCGGACF